MDDLAITPDLVDVDVPEVSLSTQVPHSITPIAESEGPGWTKDARGLVPKSADLDPLYADLVEDLCTPAQLKSALASLGTDRAMKFLGQLLKLEKVRGPGSKTIVAAAKRCGIGIDSFAEIWRSHSTALALMKLVSAAPKLADDLIVSASNRPALCPACQGEGIIELRLSQQDRRECPQCAGTGEIMRPGDKDARAHALEWAGMIGGAKSTNSGPSGSPHVYLNLVLPRKE